MINKHRQCNVSLLAISDVTNKSKLMMSYMSIILSVDLAPRPRR